MNGSDSKKKKRPKKKSSGASTGDGTKKKQTEGDKSPEDGGDSGEDYDEEFDVRVEQHVLIHQLIDPLELVQDYDEEFEDDEVEDADASNNPSDAGQSGEDDGPSLMKRSFEMAKGRPEAVANQAGREMCSKIRF